MGIGVTRRVRDGYLDNLTNAVQEWQEAKEHLAYHRRGEEDVDLFVQVIGEEIHGEEIHGVEVVVEVEVENQVTLPPSARMMEPS